MQAFPDAARAFRDVGLRAFPVMHLEVLVGAVAKELERPAPKSVSPATYCSGVEVVVWWRWIVDMRPPYSMRSDSVSFIAASMAATILLI